MAAVVRQKDPVPGIRKQKQEHKEAFLVATQLLAPARSLDPAFVPVREAAFAQHLSLPSALTIVATVPAASAASAASAADTYAFVVPVPVPVAEPPGVAAVTVVAEIMLAFHPTTDAVAAVVCASGAVVAAPAATNALQTIAVAAADAAAAAAASAIVPVGVGAVAIIVVAAGGAAAACSSQTQDHCAFRSATCPNS